MKGWLGPLFFLFARSNEEQLRRQIFFLKAELEMTRARVLQSRIFLKDDERQRLLELGTGTPAQTRTHNAANEIGTISDWANPTHDAAGNMTTIPQPKNPSNSYNAKYDAWNRLVSLDNSSAAA